MDGVAEIGLFRSTNAEPNLKDLTIINNYIRSQLFTNFESSLISQAKTLGCNNNMRGAAIP